MVMEVREEHHRTANLLRNRTVTVVREEMGVSHRKSRIQETKNKTMV